MSVMIEFQQHTPTFMPSSLMKILKKAGQSIDSCCRAIPSATTFFLFKTSLCFLSFTQLSTLLNSCTNLSSFVSVDNFPQHKIPFRNLDNLLYVLTQKIS